MVINMKNIFKNLRPVIVSFLIFTLLCGIIYPGIITGIAQLVFPNQANGSIINITLADGTTKAYGSELIAQEFTQSKYLIGRPLGTSNLSPVSAEENELVQQRIDWFHNIDPNNTSDIPSDLVTASASGVDPNISPEAADYQVARIARERNISKESVRTIIKKYTIKSFLGFFGEPAVNVLKVNLSLDNLI
jgi:potassium-transporting ATPase KdpC subunit